MEGEACVSVVSADSRALAPHSLRERDLARCSQRHLLARPWRVKLACRWWALIRGRSRTT